MKKLPGYLKKYFWEVDFGKLDYKKKSDFVIKRILEYGDEKAVRWMFENYTRQRIKRVLCKYRGYSRKTANFWGIMLGVEKSKILSLKTKSDLWQE